MVTTRQPGYWTQLTLFLQQSKIAHNRKQLKIRWKKESYKKTWSSTWKYDPGYQKKKEVGACVLAEEEERHKLLDCWSDS